MQCFITILCELYVDRKLFIEIELFGATTEITFSYVQKIRAHHSLLENGYSVEEIHN